MEDRRKDQRYDSKLDFSIKSPGDGLLSAQSVNVSARGLSCITSDAIPTMSKLNVQMELPFSNGAKEKFECTGVVVRSEKLDDCRFNVAIYFLEISEAMQGVVERYLAELA